MSPFNIKIFDFDILKSHNVHNSEGNHQKRNRSNNLSGEVQVNDL